ICPRPPTSRPFPSPALFRSATVGDQTAVVDPRTRVEDRAVGPAREALEPVDRPAALDGTGVPLRGEHDAHRRARVPLERLAGERSEEHTSELSHRTISYAVF